MSADHLQEAICQTCDAIQSNNTADRLDARYKKELNDHLRYLLRLQRATFVGKFVWNEQEQT